MRKKKKKKTLGKMVKLTLIYPGGCVCLSNHRLIGTAGVAVISKGVHGMANTTLALTGQPVLGVFNQHNTTHLNSTASLQDRYRPITSTAQRVSGSMNVAFRRYRYAHRS